MRGCPAVSYGWGRGHVRRNDEALRRFGLAEVVATRGELGRALERALARPRRPDPRFADLPSAASFVLAASDHAAHGTGMKVAGAVAAGCAGAAATWCWPAPRCRLHRGSRSGSASPAASAGRRASR